MQTPLANDLIDEVLACPCDESPGPFCRRCTYLLAFIQAMDLRQWPQRVVHPPSRTLPPLGPLHGLAYTLLGWVLQAYYVLHGVWAYGVWLLRRRRA